MDVLCLVNFAGLVNVETHPFCIIIPGLLNRKHNNAESSFYRVIARSRRRHPQQKSCLEAQPVTRSTNGHSLKSAFETRHTVPEEGSTLTPGCSVSRWKSTAGGATYYTKTTALSTKTVSDRVHPGSSCLDSDSEDGELRTDQILRSRFAL